MPPAPYVLRLFGPLTLEGGGVRLSRFPTRRAALILARLACAKDQRMGRDELAAELWPDEFLDTTRIRLRQELSRLRKSLGDLGPHLLTNRQTVEVEPGYLEADVRRFDDFVEAAGAAADPRAKASFLFDAVTQLAGPFMAGYQDPWVLAHRREYEEKARMVRLSLADAQEAVGGAKEALAATMDAVRHAPLDIDANVHLVRRLFALGQPARARRAYQEFDAMLYRELGRHAPLSLRDISGEVEAGFEIEPGNSTMRWGPLFGRSAELEAIHRALSGPGACVVLVGAPGIGKSHLLQEAAGVVAQELSLELSTDETGGQDDLLILDSPGAEGKIPGIISRHAGSRRRILATSSARLGLEGVTEIRVDPLPVPPDGSSVEEVLANPSVRLLRSRLPETARSLREAEIAHLAELARRLDGYPAALRSIAARFTIQTPEQVLTSIEDGLSEFSETRLSSGETVGSILDQTLATLSPNESDALHRLLPFDGVTADLANALADVDDPAEAWLGLEKRCLITVDDEFGARRYRIPAPIAYCIDKRQTEEERERGRAYAWGTSALWAFEKSRAMSGPEDKFAFDCVQAELPNLLRGLEWATKADALIAGRIVIGIWRTVCARGNPYRDGELILAGARAGATKIPAPLRGELWTGTAKVLSTSGRLDAAEEAYQLGLAAYRTVGDLDGEAWAGVNYAAEVLMGRDLARATELAKWAAEHTSHALDRSHAQCLYALCSISRGDTKTALQVGEAVFAERLKSEDATTQGRAYGDLAEIYRRAGRYEAARPLLREAIRRLRETEIQDFLMDAMISLANLESSSRETQNLLAEALALARQIGSNAKQLEIARLQAGFASNQGDRAEALAAIEEMMRATQVSQSPPEREKSLRALGETLERLGAATHANAVFAAIGDARPADEPAHPGWQMLLSSDSHTTVCVLAVEMAKEALGNEGA